MKSVLALVLVLAVAHGSASLRGQFVKPTQVPRGSLSGGGGLQAGATQAAAAAPAAAGAITNAAGVAMDKTAKVDDSSRKSVEARHQENGSDPEIVKAAPAKEQGEEKGQQGQQGQQGQGEKKQGQGEQQQQQEGADGDVVSRQKVKIDTNFHQAPSTFGHTDEWGVGMCFGRCVWSGRGSEMTGEEGEVGSRGRKEGKEGRGGVEAVSR